MRTEDYFRSLSAELLAVRDRVRYMIEDRHWPTDGEWKESVLRTLIRRSAPSTVSVGRGFVVSATGCSSQLDVLIHDNSHPVLYRDGDLVFVAPGACRAMIEVKSRVTASSFRAACNKLSIAADFVRSSPGGRNVFVGLFSYEASDIESGWALAALDDSAKSEQRRVIDHVVLGPDNFIKWWNLSPATPRREHRSWHSYELQAMSAGYFVHNLLMHVSPNADEDNDAIWFPDYSKETHLIGQHRLSGA